MSQPPRIRARSRTSFAGDAAAAASDQKQTNTPTRMARLEVWPVERFVEPAGGLRRPGKTQLAKLEKAMFRHGFTTPLIAAADGTVIDGLKRLSAARAVGYAELPVAVLDEPTAVEIKALRISLNKLGELGSWDDDDLAAAFKDILAEDPSLIDFTGFDMAEVDKAFLSLADPVAETLEPPEPPITPVSRLGDLWRVGQHRILCGDAKKASSYEELLGATAVQMVLSDVPYGVKISGVVSRSHDEFVEGSNISDAQARLFFDEFLLAANAYIPPGCIAEFFIDYRSMFALTGATRQAGLQHLATIAWDKTTGGLGGLWRNQVEFVLATKKPGAAHINNVGLGKHGRNRTTLWSAPGYAGFSRERQAALARHPTSKPVGLLMDAILDVTNIGGVVLDMFAGSASTLVAAHRVQRIGMGIELDPRFVDVSVQRLQEATGEPARHEQTDLSFAEVAAQRLAQAHAE